MHVSCVCNTRLQSTAIYVPGKTLHSAEDMLQKKSTAVTACMGLDAEGE